MKVVVVGGTSGIGEATARRFVEAGADVLVAGRDKERLSAALARLQKAQGESVDAGQAAQMQSFFERVGSFEHLIVSVTGGVGRGPLRDLTVDAIRAGMEQKLFAYVTTMKAALGRVQQSITLVSAASARAAIPGTAGLAAVNGAIEAMIHPLAAELAPLRINAVSPGVIDTPWWDRVGPAKGDILAGVAKSLPAGRVGTADDVAQAIAMVAQNKFLTGTVFEVDGGGHLARG